MAKKQGKEKTRIGDIGYLENLTGGGNAPTPKATEKKTPARRASDKPKKEMERATFHIGADLLNECKNAVVFLAGGTVRLTLTGLIDAALTAELERLQKEHNKGKPFPQRDGTLKGGRPVK